MSVKKPTYRLVYAFSIHPYLGNLFEAFAIKLNHDSSFSLSFNKVNSHNLRTELYDVSNQDRKIIELIDQYAEEQIVRRFHNKVLKFYEFIQKTDNKKLHDQIRPYIEKRLLAIYSLLITTKIPLYFKGSKKEHIQDQALKFLKNKTEIIFNFSRNQSDLSYFLSIRNGKKPIKLFEKDLYTICTKPAIILLDNQIHYFDDEIDSKKLHPFINKEFVLIPKNKEKQYFKSFIYNSIRKYEVHPHGFSIQQSSKNPIPGLHIQKNRQGLYVLKLAFDYGPKTVHANDTNSCYIDLKISGNHYHFTKFIRQPEFETKIKNFIKSSGLKCLEKADYIPESGEELHKNSLYRILNYLNLNEAQLLKQGIKIIQADEEVNYYTGKIKLELHFNEKPDWFDVHAVVQFNQFEIPFIRLRKNLINEIREYKLPDGSIAILPEEWFEQYRDVLAFAEKKEDNLLIKKQFFNVLETVPGFNSDFKERFFKLSAIESINNYELPLSIQAELRPYQEIGFHWMQSLIHQHFGCCLADDMGLGKTLQALMLIQMQKENMESRENSIAKDQQENSSSLDERNKRSTSLIVMPTSLMFNWANEIKKFTPGLRFLMHEGNNRRKSNRSFKQFDIILSSYGLVRNDIDLFKDYPFHCVILDESQFIKNSDSKGFKAMMQLTASHRIILTGTPIQNSLSDLWSQMSFINPGLLGDKKFFKKEFIHKIEKKQDPLAAEKLKKLIGPFILRRTKSEVAQDLPVLSEQVHYCSMTDAQYSYYEKKKSQIRNLLLGHIKSGEYSKKMIAVLKALMQLRLIANHPGLVDADYREDSGKFNEILRFMDNALAGEHKVLLYSSFVKHLNLFVAQYEKTNTPYLMLSGRTKLNERKKLVEKFQHDPDSRLFLVSIKAGGVGLNLTAADYVFILDPWWNPAVESQAINRAHRIGQDKKVFAYKFITKESIEEKILNLQKSKKGLADEFINTNNPLRGMNPEEIEELFE
ncbi:MAG: ATP-dependent helicase [Bacteroidetes bacterium]|nr:ATP-dependent helicase [Bacteroidota bacterium]